MSTTGTFKPARSTLHSGDEKFLDRLDRLSLPASSIQCAGLAPKCLIVLPRVASYAQVPHSQGRSNIWPPALTDDVALVTSSWPYRYMRP